MVEKDERGNDALENAFVLCSVKQKSDTFNKARDLLFICKGNLEYMNWDWFTDAKKLD